MRLDQLPNLRVEDFPSEQSWINRLFVQFNPFIQSLYQVVNGNLDFETNIKSISKEYTITTFQQFSFLWTFTDSAPLDVRVTQAFKGTQQTPTILLLAWSYNATTKVVTISRIVEVNATGVGPLDGSSYQFTIRGTI